MCVFARAETMGHHLISWHRTNKSFGKLTKYKYPGRCHAKTRPPSAKITISIRRQIIQMISKNPDFEALGMNVCCCDLSSVRRWWSTLGKELEGVELNVAAGRFLCNQSDQIVVGAHEHGFIFPTAQRTRALFLQTAISLAFSHRCRL